MTSSRDDDDLCRVKGDGRISDSLILVEPLRNVLDELHALITIEINAV